MDDEPANRRLVAAILGPLGHALTFASDGEEAVRLAGAGRYALILMDYQMPRMDGLQAARLIRSAALPDAPRVPIVALTACWSLADRMDAALDAVLLKPLEPATLVAAVCTWLQRPAPEA